MDLETLLGCVKTEALEAKPLEEIKTEPEPLTPDEIDAIEARANAATPGPWNVWGGPEYCGGGKDLCIGAGEEWIANMDHRWGPGYQERVDHQSDGGRSEDCDCPICTFSDEVTKEQADTAEFIAAAREDIPRLIATVRQLQSLVTNEEVNAYYDAAGRFLEAHAKENGYIEGNSLPDWLREESAARMGHFESLVETEQQAKRLIKQRDRKQEEAEALRTALKECVEAYYCDPAIKSNDGRVARAHDAAKEALGNG